ncbi:hypothetical protein C0Q70_09970 [Pomacea canaliculata]|uniref:Uncharacterized protein n=2 Tax=Pomacea canaliculata TaxID=400727 RepID=A0A2T7PBA8_POMCA|nr:hypothetical protein C0Q70_09970 [Pomacea canaliculata]
MQLLTMAMQREHEGDSNGNHLKSTTASSTGTTASTVCQCPPAARPAAQLDVQLELECPERSLTISAPPSVSWPCELQNAAFQTDAGTNNSGVLCPPADINCNPLGPAGSDEMEEKDAENDARGGVGERLLLAHALAATQAAFGEEGSDRDDEESGDDSLGSCNALYRLQTSILVSTTTTLQADHSTVNDSVTSSDTSVGESTTGRSPHHKQLTTDSRSPKNRLAWQISAQPSGSVSSRFAALSSWPTHPSARHSVDMETDDQLSLEHDAPSLRNHADVKLVAARATDAKAHDSHELPHLPGSHGGECITPVLITPVSLVPSSAERGRCESLRMTPPIWTALALRLAASTQEEAPAGRQWRGAVSHRPAASRLALPCLAELEDVVKAMNRSVSLSPKLSHKVSPSKRAPMISPNKLAHKVSTNKRVLTRRNRSASPASPLGGSIAARSPRRARLRRAEAASGLGTALREVDVFLEALLEDECALYAGRLQAFFRHDTACDRTELPDPVAKILNEGDDMHFVPIRQEAGLLAAVEGSAFSYYIPT